MTIALSSLLATGVPPLDAAATAAADARQAQLTKPAGSMGRLESLGSRLAGMYAVCPPPIPEPAVVAVFAGDHGVHAQGVSPWPQEVTVQMVANVAAGGAVVNALARQVGASVCVIDVGVAGALPPGVDAVGARIVDGTADFTTGPALTR
ncbi:MAG TPA: nicotinate-nucleotide--dimethylbenzimidazole phosphoribosyltransferase, partial [Dermatophilaceae bacterium]|nr:nicotinate-nucleotide--dimethylbenzimidazole phosphoribosyltransferase [Dermatophilaceae bacterium]